MQPWYVSEKVRAMDAKIISSGTPGLVLMERAGLGVSEFISSLGAKGSALVLAGAGNNGGDGFVIARYLKSWGWKVDIILSHPRERSKGDAKVNLDRLENILTVESSTLSDFEISSSLNDHDIIIDALLGTGITGQPRGETLRLIELLNATRNGRKVLAVDIPSGLEGGGTCVKAEWTCTIGGRKLPMATGHGAALSGKIHFVSLGEGTDKFLENPEAFEISVDDVRSRLPIRRADDHKGRRGGVLLVAGSKRYRGAALLAARGALRMGAGIVVLASCPQVIDPLSYQLPEAIVEPLENPDEFSQIIQKWSKRCSTMLIGSGLDRDDRARELCIKASKEWLGPSLWDGDGLYWLANEKLKPYNCSITPHEGEASVLLGVRSIGDRFEVVRELSLKYGSALLKGYHSLVMGNKMSVPAILTAGDRTLSIPGSGDVLAGAASAMLAAGLDGADALTVAAWCHGMAGERLARSVGKDGVLAHEVADALPAVLKELYEL